ncbi:MAG: hypothetical protein C3F13_18060 [Anaerolineales bacterium]|nr:hypothetical protein [Anaerolineae bacterium]PWB49743.1 MAG: hypothetical protein C3F13_18060 [Anaerolineales bacterium]
MTKTAMVAPKSVVPSPGSAEKLALILAELGVNRPYFVISSQAFSWHVHFEGDRKGSVVKRVNGKFTIIPDR